MIGHIYISGLIGSYTDDKGVLHKGIELLDVISQVQKQKDSEEFVLHINSEGGGVDAGYDIYNYLKSLPQKITTVIEGMCASMATVVALAGDVRIMTSESKFMIHNPWMGNVQGDADELLSAHESIKAEEDKMISFYADHTGVLREGFDALMKSETYLTPEQALELGFIHEVRPSVKALAFKKTNDTMSKKLEEKLDSFLLAMGKLIKGEKTEEKKLAMIVSDSNGVSLEIKKADGSEIEGKPAKDDLVTADGKPAEGSYILPDMGLTIEVKAGVISSVTDTAAPAEGAEDPAAELAKAQARIKELETIVEENKKSSESIESKMALMEKSFKAIASKYQPEGRTTEFRKEKEGEPENRILAAKKRKEDYKTKK